MLAFERDMLNPLPADGAILTVRSRAIRQRGISVIVLMGLLMFLTWRELASEFDASIRDFASSLNIHDGMDSQ